MSTSSLFVNTMMLSALLELKLTSSVADAAPLDPVAAMLMRSQIESSPSASPLPAHSELCKALGLPAEPVRWTDGMTWHSSGTLPRELCRVWERNST